MVVLLRGKKEAEILEFLTLEGELIVELDALPTEVKRTMLRNLREIKKLPKWVQDILLTDINAAVVNRISVMKREKRLGLRVRVRKRL